MKASPAKNFFQAIDLTLGRAGVTATEVESLCDLAQKHGVAAVCVSGSRVAQAHHLLENSAVKVCCLVGFPLGEADLDAKRYEVEAAIDSGAQELDVVMNTGRLMDGDHAYVLRELRDIVEASDERMVKVLIETSLLTRAETILAAQLIVESGAQAAGAGTSFLSADASMAEVKLLREVAGDKFEVKACTRAPDTPTVLALLQAGATRLGIAAAQDFAQKLEN